MHNTWDTSYLEHNQRSSVTCLLHIVIAFCSRLYCFHASNFKARRRADSPPLSDHSGTISRNYRDRCGQGLPLAVNSEPFDSFIGRKVDRRSDA